MDKHYTPHEIEAKWYQAWETNGLFHGACEDGGDPYAIMIPPPNVTGILHMGHALNNTIQDILARWHRMRGRNVIWVPGTDHAGIATQNVVERALSKEGSSRKALGREAFVERVWQWRDTYGGTIVRQLRRLGASCDWSRERFTMDEGLSEAVTEVFVRLFDKGLIYRGNYIINWCPRCHTALSDEESEHQDHDGNLWHIRYPVRTEDGAESGRDVVVATTRPETLLGDVAVAVHPDDARYRDLDRLTVMLPLLDRELAVIRDSAVDPAFGTGAVKVTPAHDPNDFEMAQRHNLTPINIMNGDGTMNEAAGPYAGLDRFACRERLLADLDAAGLLVKVEPHRHAVGHCYRCDTVVEPRLSPQWFVRMGPLAAPAIEAVRSGRIRFVPARWTKVYLDWMENIRDWCISRQIWWGHRIPVFTCEACEHTWAAKATPDRCPACKNEAIRQEEDVLDTWFSSWLWPFSTLGWPEANADLAYYYPTRDLVTASEIIFFWVARMIMAGYEFMGDIPFDTVYIHGTVRDDNGRKMSKSLGNAIDPIEIIEAFSADALRFSLIMLTATGQDVYVSREKFEIGRNFGTKLWNAARFLRLHTPETLSQAWDGRAEFEPALLSADDRHILAMLQQAMIDHDAALEAYRFNDAAHVLYEFVWHQYCDWYVESAKTVLYGDDEARRAQVLRVMHHVFASALRLLHPLMPFLTEELWHAMGYAELSALNREAVGGQHYILRAPWPTAESAATLTAWGADAATVAYVTEKHELIRTARMLRADLGVAPTRTVSYVLKPRDKATADRLRADAPALAALLRAEPLTIDASFKPARAMPGVVSALGAVYMAVEGLLDIEKEIERLGGQRDKALKDLDGVTRKLARKEFVTRAPESVVEQVRDRKQQLLERRAKLDSLINALRG